MQPIACFAKLVETAYWTNLAEQFLLSPAMKQLNVLKVGFLTGRDSAPFWTKGRKSLHCPETKRQWDKLKTLLQGGPGQPVKKSGTGRGMGQ